MQASAAADWETGLGQQAAPMHSVGGRQYNLSSLLLSLCVDLAHKTRFADQFFGGQQKHGRCARVDPEGRGKRNMQAYLWPSLK